jgi:SAM-dependent methyltransferase
MRVDPSNLEQANAWDGDEGEYWASHAERFDQAVAGYHRRFLDAAAIAPTDEVLDIGCGTGQTTLDAARCAPSGSVLGVDLSARMIEVARREAARHAVTNARFLQADAQLYPFPDQSFDAAISRTGAMFFGDPQAAFTNIGRALRPGGRLVLLVWQAPSRNEWFTAFSTAMAAGRPLPAPPPQAPGPFSLSEPARVRDLLTTAGFHRPQLTSWTEPMSFGRTTEEAYQFVSGLTGWMLQGLDGAGRARARGALRETLAAHTSRDRGVVYASAAWLVTATRPR